MTGTLHEDVCAFVCRSVLLRMTDVSNKSCNENQNAFYLFICFSFWKVLPCVIMWKNMVEPDRPQMTIWRMRFACSVPKATNTQYFHCNNGCTNASCCYVPRTLRVLLSTEFVLRCPLVGSHWETNKFGLQMKIMICLRCTLRLMILC